MIKMEIVGHILPILGLVPIRHETAAYIMEMRRAIPVQISTVADHVSKYDSFIKTDRR